MKAGASSAAITFVHTPLHSASTPRKLNGKYAARSPASGPTFAMRFCRPACGS